MWQKNHAQHVEPIRTDGGSLSGPEWNLPITATKDPNGWIGVASSPQLLDGVVVFTALDGKAFAVQG